MRRILLFLQCILIISNINPAFYGETLVPTSDGFKPIQYLKIGDKVICRKNDNTLKFKPITAIHKKEALDVFKIITYDGSIITSGGDAQFFTPKTASSKS